MVTIVAGQVVVPDCTNLGADSINLALGNVFLLGNFQNTTSAVTAGLCVRQDPNPGTPVDPGTIVTVFLSDGLGGFRVRAASVGFYNGLYYAPGDVFDLQASSDFSDATQNYQAGGNEYAPGWMLEV